MKTLAEFLANHINRRPGARVPISEIRQGIRLYKKHLQNDSPNTVHWAMIERDLIVALERMQCQDSLEGARHNNQIKHPCLEPSTYPKALGCVNCESLSDCTNRENRHCEECLLFDLQVQGNCKEPGYGTTAENKACDRFKLRVIEEN